VVVPLLPDLPRAAPVVELPPRSIRESALARAFPEYTVYTFYDVCELEWQVAVVRPDNVYVGFLVEDIRALEDPMILAKYKRAIDYASKAYDREHALELAA
jgi:hypothetical protein